MAYNLDLVRRLQQQALAALTFTEIALTTEGAERLERAKMLDEGYNSEELGDGAKTALSVLIDREVARTGIPIAEYIAQLRAEILAFNMDDL